jgi:cation diffusion facilitator CzcD-associated flavoprotein CzcO
MTKKQDPQAESNPRTSKAEFDEGKPLIDRREFFGSAAALTVGSLSATAAVAQTSGAENADAAGALELQTQRAQRWAGRGRTNWVRPRTGVDHDVVIVGGGQSGLTIAYGLKRKGVTQVEVVDQAEPGRTGIWRTIARMDQLRTGKALIGLEGDNPTLGFRAWFETLNGPDAFDALDRIPRLAWADYVDWFQQITDTTVRYGTRLIEIEPDGDLLRLHLDDQGARRVETTRKLVLANGYVGSGGANLPGFLRTLPKEFWSHTSEQIDFDALAGKAVGVIGAASSAFDAAGVALEAGATEVHMFNRRPYVGYPGGSPASGPSDRGHANAREMAYELPDVVRWRNFLRGERSVSTVPTDSIARAVAFDDFRLHLETSLENVRADGGQVVASVNGETQRLDYLIAGTGYRIDLTAQPELMGIEASIARWADRYEPESGEDNAGAAIHPYLGPGFEFLPRDGVDAAYLRNIHNFNLSARLSMGMLIGDVPSCIYHPRIISAIAKDLYVASVDTAAHRAWVESPMSPADPAPYERAIQSGVSDAA